MKIHTAEKPDAAKVKRLLKAWDYGVEIEDMEDRFAPLSRSEIYKILKANGRQMQHNGGVIYGRGNVA